MRSEDGSRYEGCHAIMWGVMAKKTHHVLPGATGGWAVKRGGASRASKIFPTKHAAEVYCRRVSVREQSDLVIHGRDGTIQRKDSHGSDPLPPLDKR